MWLNQISLLVGEKYRTEKKHMLFLLKVRNLIYHTFFWY